MPPSQFALFQWLRYRLTANAGTLLLGNSRVRLYTVLACSLLVWVAVFGAGLYGFGLLNKQNIPFAGGVIGILFDLLFLALGTMLVFSTGIILYSGLYNAAETTFLLSTPAAADQVFGYKFGTALAFSSWAFLLLGTPILISYGVQFEVSWAFFVLLPLFLIGFLFIPGAAGAVGCLLAVNFWPRRKKSAIALAILLGLLVLGYWGFRVLTAVGRQMAQQRDALQDLFNNFGFAQSAFAPSHWLARGLQASARGQLDAAAYDLALLWSNGLFLYVVAAWLARRLYRRGYNRRSTGGVTRRAYRSSWIDRVAATVLSPLDRPTQLLIEKDFRTFRRDPSQWGQLLIFAALVPYALNFQQFMRPDISLLYRNGVSLLNLAATAILMCAYMGRFIFPMLSLEGRKFWILGLLPLTRAQLLKGKFVFAASGAVIVAEALMLLGDLLLAMPPIVIGIHVLTVALLALGLASLSVGLGAVMPNFKESDPSKITVGVGGTLNLIAGLIYLLVIVGLMAAPYHLQAVFRSGDDGMRLNINYVIVAAGVVAGLVVGVFTVWLPLRAGARALERMEF